MPSYINAGEAVWVNLETLEYRARAEAEGAEDDDDEDDEDDEEEEDDKDKGKWASSLLEKYPHLFIKWIEAPKKNLRWC